MEGKSPNQGIVRQAKAEAARPGEKTSATSMELDPREIVGAARRLRQPNRPWSLGKTWLEGGATPLPVSAMEPPQEKESVFWVSHEAARGHRPRLQPPRRLVAGSSAQRLCQTKAASASRRSFASRSAASKFARLRRSPRRHVNRLALRRPNSRSTLTSNHEKEGAR